MNSAKLPDVRSTHRVLAFLHTSNEQTKKEIKGKKSIYNTIKRFQYLEISLTKENKSLKPESHKVLLQKGKEDK